MNEKLKRKYGSAMERLSSKKNKPALRHLDIGAAHRGEQKFCGNKVNSSKYTVWNFLPKNIFNQFKLHMNKYFLLIGILQTIPSITPVNPWSTWAPLLAIFLFSTVKELLDFIRVSKKDAKINNAPCTVFRKEGSSARTDSESFKKEVRCQDIKVGDIVAVTKEQSVPCDLLLLASSRKDGVCFVSTANLDGETSYKSKKPPSEFGALFKSTTDVFVAEVVSLSYSQPNAALHSFSGTLKTSADSGGRLVSFNETAFLPACCTVKNTNTVYGLAVYTGKETKFGLSTIASVYKLSPVERKTNTLIIWLFLAQLSVSVVLGLLGHFWRTRAATTQAAFWQYPVLHSSAQQILTFVSRFLLLASTVIPVSLKVALDLFKLFSSLLLAEDKSLDTGVANNTSIPESLGQVEYVLTDKTGTLTKNSMFLREISTGAIVFNVVAAAAAKEGAQTLESLRQKLRGADEKARAELRGFMTNLALNNSVAPTAANDYEFTSPDEMALVSAGDRLSLKLSARHGEEIQLTDTATGATFAYRTELELEFTSERRCSSVVLTELFGARRTVLFCKGADEVLRDLFVESQQRDEVLKETQRYAAFGLRTLCFGYRELSADEVAALPLWKQQLAVARENGATAFVRVCAQFEQGLAVQGVAAIEDELQDGVPEAISEMAKARIRFWMITGDKSSTAREIARNCKIVDRGANEVLLDAETVLGPAAKEHRFSQADSSLAKLRATLSSLHTSFCFGNAAQTGGFVLSVKGEVLELALRADRQRFAQLCLAANAVVFSRVSPQQKAQLVEVAKSGGNHVLAIGDGGNDVSMLRAADVGVGLRGQEGLQAANSADFQLGRFRDLLPLLFFHGTNAYRRVVRVIQLSFYKSIFFCCLQFGFNFFAQFSGASLFGTQTILLYNFALFLPILFMTFDLELSKEDAAQIGFRKYNDSLARRPYRKVTFGGWCVRGLLQAAALLVLAVFVFRHAYSLHELGYWVFLVYFGVVTATIVSETKTVSPLLLTCTSLSVVGVLAYLLFAAAVLELDGLHNHRALWNVLADLYALGYGFAVCLLMVVSLKVYSFFWRLNSRAH